MKVEKVVSPPKNPTVKNNFNWGGILYLCKIKLQIYPKIKQPIMFALNVAKGRLNFDKARLIKYLKLAPIPPPKNTKRKLNMVFSLQKLKQEAQL